MDSLTDADSVLKFYREIIDGDVISEHLFDSDVMQAFSELAEAAVIERHNRGIDDPEYHRGLLI